MTDFRITTQHDSAGVVRLLVAGEADLATAGEIAAATEQALADHRPARLIIDLGAVTFLDSSGLSNLLTAHRLATESGTDLHVVNATGGPLRVLTLTGLLDVLNPDAGATAATGDDR